MAEYIDKEALETDLNIRLSSLRNNNGYYDHYTDGFDECVDRVENFPAADVVEVKHGRWVYDPDGMDWGLGAWLCSECRCRNNNLGMDGRINPLRFSGSKFCPHCGAKMDLRGKTNGKN